MEHNKICQVHSCSWPVVLCPELCAPHWWRLPKDTRQAVLKAQTRGQKDGNHPNGTYTGLIAYALGCLNAFTESRARYEHQPDDVDSRHARHSYCSECQCQTVHHSFIRDGEPFLYCSICQTMIPAIPAGAHVLPGMENPS